MLSQAPNNLLEIDGIIEAFVQDYHNSISNLHKHYFHSSDILSLQAIIEELKDELRTGCVSFFNKNYPIEELNSYLFYIVNAFCKKRVASEIKKATEYLCPGCLFLGKESVAQYINYTFKCETCTAELRETTDPKRVLFYRTFFRHNKQGYRCQDCDRFLPHPLDESPIVSCPYFDCCFVGSWAELKRMHHPSTQINKEKSILDGNSSLHEKIADGTPDALVRLEVEEDIQEKMQLLHEIIDFQRNSVPYSSSDFTVKHKILVYNAFENLLQKYPVDMVSYLMRDGSGYSGFQAKVFQEYIRLLEETIPFSYKKGKEVHKVESLLDDSLTLFDGISNFEGMVNEKGIIKNETKEFYIGGRKGAVAKPYYIGKLLNVVDALTKEVLIGKVTDYTFSLIRTRDIVPGTSVIVTHLRAPPHYQMGGMAYVNRIRKKIVERVKNNE
jgi:hypothetical protein